MLLMFGKGNNEKFMKVSKLKNLIKQPGMLCDISYTPSGIVNFLRGIFPVKVLDYVPSSLQVWKLYISDEQKKVWFIDQEWHMKRKPCVLSAPTSTLSYYNVYDE